MNPWSIRAFRAAVVDAIFASLALIPTWFLKPEIVAQVALFVGIWQLPIVLWVVGPEIKAFVDYKHDVRELEIRQLVNDIEYDKFNIERVKLQAKGEGQE